ncbi:hypothetical protein GH741_04100 [Aquibacillus halophilus]|uniref:Uncharacterized protein n=1 Tax=Aquibacillus halophilus TaxID=930132 RepID=A0A6A8D8D3_9BACI|nr:hypothetical protein [Aquibacillus halophilus]MRH41854.1 hypothetical protein [Aquibacillus halophilus]
MKIKRLTLLIILMLLFISVTIYWFMDTSSAKLVEIVEIQQQKDDFIVHIRVETNDKGFQILRSLEYTGDEPITIDHRTPLISVSIIQKNHDFTGSHVNKVLNPGNIYHPQKPQSYNSLEEGDYNLYMHSQFFIDGEEVNIFAEKEISFQ